MIPVSRRDIFTKDNSKNSSLLKSNVFVWSKDCNLLGSEISLSIEDSFNLNVVMSVFNWCEISEINSCNRSFSVWAEFLAASNIWYNLCRWWWICDSNVSSYYSSKQEMLPSIIFSNVLFSSFVNKVSLWKMPYNTIATQTSKKIV